MIRTIPETRWLGIVEDVAPVSANPATFEKGDNIVIDSNGLGFRTRPGNKLTIGSPGVDLAGCGTSVYRYFDPTTGVQSDQLVSFGRYAARMLLGSVGLSYGLSFSTLAYSVTVNSSTQLFEFRLFKDSVQVLLFNLGKGYDEVAITLANLQTAVNAVSGWTMTITGISSSARAALALDIADQTLFSGSSTTLTARYWEQVPTPSGATAPFQGLYDFRTNADFENASTYNHNECLYINSGRDPQQKYDGVKVYRSGCPITQVVATGIGAGSVDAGVRQYALAVQQTDAKGNLVTGELCAYEEAVLGVASQVQLDWVPPQPSSGFNTDRATVNGNQVGVTTIAVTGNTIKVGDPVAVINRATGQTLTDRIALTGTNATTLVISGSAINVNNADIISAGLVACIVRLKVGGFNPFVVARIPMNSAVGNQTYIDNLADSSIVELFELPPDGFDRGLPPRGKYGCVWNGIPVLASTTNDQNAVFWPLAAEPEAWPNFNFEPVDIRSQLGISGIEVSEGQLAITSQTSVHIVDGWWYDGSYQQRELSRGYGVASHSSLCPLPDGGLFALSRQGPIVIRQQTVEPLFESLRKTFRTGRTSANKIFSHRRSVSVYDSDDRRLLCFIPVEDPASGHKAANTDSIIIVGNISTDNQLAFTKFSQINAAGGLVFFNSQVWYQQRRFSSYSSMFEFETGRFSDGVLTAEAVAHEKAIADDLVLNPLVISGDDGQEKFIPSRVQFSSVPYGIPLQFDLETRLDLGTVRDSYFMAMLSSSSGEGFGLFRFGQVAFGQPVSSLRYYNLKKHRCSFLTFRMFCQRHQKNLAVSNLQLELSDEYEAIL